MSGNKPKPAYMYLEDGGNRDSRKTKKEIKNLQDNTIIIGGKNFEIPKSVLENDIAKEKWFDIMELYKEADLPITTNADVGLLERYCLTYWEYKMLISAKQDALKKGKDSLQAAAIVDKLKIDTKIDKKNALLMRMDEQLFLTPLSKCRAIPRNRKNPIKDKLKENGFDL